jgi:hypothetical protein
MVMAVSCSGLSRATIAARPGNRRVRTPGRAQGVRRRTQAGLKLSW